MRGNDTASFKKTSNVLLEAISITLPKTSIDLPNSQTVFGLYARGNLANSFTYFFKLISSKFNLLISEDFNLF